MPIEPKQDMTRQQKIWLIAYLDKGSKTYMNGTRSAAAAYPEAKQDITTLSVLGAKNTKSPLIRPLIDAYLNDSGMSDDALVAKIKDLMQAKETKFFSKDGVITDSVEVEALETQRRTLDMALKVKGKYESHNRQQAVIIQPPEVNKPDDAGK